MPFNPIDYPAILTRINKVSPVSPDTIPHLPVAFLAFSILRPRTFVELGVYAGPLYMAICDLTLRLQTDTKCFGIDTWEGGNDMHDRNLPYNTHMLPVLQFHNKPYEHFSTLIKSTFTAALPLFEDGSIDLLHIDGNHYYSCVSEDFETWLPKMSDRGVILMHDTSIDYVPCCETWMFWKKIKRNYPHFNFSHRYGMGLLAVGKHPSQPILDLCAEEYTPEGDKIRTFFREIGNMHTVLFAPPQYMTQAERENQ